MLVENTAKGVVKNGIRWHNHSTTISVLNTCENIGKDPIHSRSCQLVLLSQQSIREICEFGSLLIIIRHLTHFAPQDRKNLMSIRPSTPPHQLITYHPDSLSA